ncbi:MAG: CaiB/BaiF CoA-transferase family protein [Pseudomonadota bacterium]
MVDTQKNGPIRGLKVLELAHVMAGPTCGRVLADLGADVIKLERIEGEDCRRMAPPWQGDEAAGFLMLNRNKKGIAVNLKTKAGLQILFDLVAQSDVLIENFRKGTMEKLGAGYEVLKVINPRLIYCEISGYGRTGPYADKGGFDLVAQAMSGILSVTGEGIGRPPVKAGVPVADIGAGLFATIGILAAVAERETSGAGQRVDASLFEAASAFMTWPAAMHLAEAEPAQPMGTAHPLDAPYQAFKAADGWFIVGAANQSNWLRLLEAIDAQSLQHDDRFKDNPSRVANLDALTDTLSKLFRKHPKVYWIERLEEAGVPTGPINSVAEMLNDPQTLSREMVVETEHSTLGVVKTMATPIRFSRTPSKVDCASPVLGENTVDVLKNLGYSNERIQHCIEKNVVIDGAVKKNIIAAE